MQGGLTVRFPFPKTITPASRSLELVRVMQFNLEEF